MKQGGDRKKASGFTIVETLIVLAVTGILLVSAMLYINGRQNKTEFSTAINNLQQKLQQIINETGSGYFPQNDSYVCSVNLATNQPNIVPGAGSQGSNQSCIFLGKVVQFGLQSSSGGGNQQFAVYPMAGNRQGTQLKGTFFAGGAEPAPYTQAKVYEQLQYGLNVVYMTYATTTVPSTNTGGIGFLAGGSDANGIFATPDSTGLKPGSQQISLYAIKNTKAVNPAITDEPSMQTQLSALDGTNLDPATSVSICFASATTDQSGLITISGGDGMGVTLQIHGGTACA